MLVPAMNLEEIRKEIAKDFEIVERKSRYVEKDLKRLHAPLRDKRIIKVYDYHSKFKNNWIFKWDVDKKVSIPVYLIWYIGHRGLTAIQTFPRTDCLFYYTSHYFKRYNERLDLGINDPKQLLHTFMHNHLAYTFQYLEEVNRGVWKFFAYTKNGVALGTYIRSCNYYKMNTFITHDMLKGDQLEIEAYKKAELDKYLATYHKLD
ncbi:MAG: hypothetical protein K9J17_07830 [Flavobacteriales bacterium]|nr:hypothetical protein [Flavobacteriales bacterium]